MFAWVEASSLKTAHVAEEEKRVKSWLVAHGWKQHVNAFFDNGICDLETLQILTQDDLKTIG